MTISRRDGGFYCLYQLTVNPSTRLLIPFGPLSLVASALSDTIPNATYHETQTNQNAHLDDVKQR